MNSYLRLLNVTTLSTEDAKIELNTGGSELLDVGIYTNISGHGGEIYLQYDVSKKKWEFNRDLNIVGNLTVSDSTTISDTLLVVNAATMNSTLDVVAASSLHSTLQVSGASSLEST